MRLRNLLMTVSMLLTVAAPLARTSAARAEVCDKNDPALLKPDLKALPPSRVRVLQRGQIRRVIFATTVANLGAGPLFIEGKTINTASGPVTLATQKVRRRDGSECTVAAGSFEFHPSHNHFHLNDFSSYELFKDAPLTGTVVAKSDKVSFCIADIAPIRGVDTPRQVLANCGTQEGIQGISVGWADVYDNYLPEQWIDVAPDVPAGQYFLTNTADPDDSLLEENESAESNAGTVSVSLPGLLGSGTGTQPTPTATIGGPANTPTPERSPVVRPTRRPRPPISERPIHPMRPDRPPRATPIRSN